MLNAQEDTARYLNPTRSVTERVDDLVLRMTLAEKLGQLMQLDAIFDLEDIVVEKLAGSILHASPDLLAHAHALTQETRLRIPLLVAEDCIHGHSFWPGATIFPVQLAMAASWDAQLVEQAARATAVEASATGVHWVFSPVLCIARDPRWGRVNETFGEDPFLIGELGVAMIRGYQGRSISDPEAVLACAKHFVGYSETQGGRDASEADLSQRKVRSWHIPPFQRAAAAGCRTFMLGYQSLEGVPITANRWLLDEVLRGEWDYPGLLVTDYDNVGRLVWEQRVAADIGEAAALTVNAGNDMTMTTPTFAAGAQQALERGAINEAQIDAAVRRILTVKFELGLFEDARLPSMDRQRAVIGNDAHADLNLSLARRTLVLLQNNGVLPLALPSGGTGRIAVIGPNADDALGQLGDWAGSSGQVTWMPEGHPRDLIETVLDGLLALAPAQGWIVEYARGADIMDPRVDAKQIVMQEGQLGPTPAHPAPIDEAMQAQAVELAELADHVVLVIGDHVNLNGEAKSTATLELFGAQICLVDAVLATGTPTTVVVISGKPQVLPASALAADAIVQAFSPGMRGGRAIAELLLGRIEPSGRLPISIPRHAGQLPVYYNTVRGQHGDSYADLTQEPQFAFGHGLSYTDVSYSALHVLTPQVEPDGVVRARVEVSNTGDRPALETVQVYIRDMVTSATWADRELKAFQQVHLEPGTTETVEVTVPAADCSIVDAAGNRVVEPGAFDLLVGPSSRPEDLLTANFEIFDHPTHITADEGAP
ncbi:MAG: glycoside hydrolase family 3 N-terminal domain-containing protein [Ornithinimicrobium sp.]